MLANFFIIIKQANYWELRKGIISSYFRSGETVGYLKL